MGKSLIFKMDGQEYSLEPIRLDRKKLYGWTETLALDDQGRTCQLVAIDGTGSLLIPAGGLGQGMVDENGCWVERAELAVLDGGDNLVPLLPASFDSPLDLEDTVTIEDFLDHYITAIYTMKGEEECPELVKAIAEGPIYTFPFNFRASHEASPAFLLEREGELFLLVGKKAEFEMISLVQAGVLDEDEEPGDSEDEELDFGMM
jgi:hypothetical protein